jgi:hypothetical protein
MAQPTAPKRQLRPTTSLPSTAEHYGELHGLDPELQARLQNIGRKGRQGECGVASGSSARTAGGEGTGERIESDTRSGGGESEVQGRRDRGDRDSPGRKRCRGGSDAEEGYRGGSEEEEIPKAKRSDAQGRYGRVFPHLHYTSPRDGVGDIYQCLTGDLLSSSVAL